MYMSNTKQQKTPHGDLLRTQTNAEENQNKEDFGTGIPYTNEPIPGTPFRVIGDREQGYRLICGKTTVAGGQDLVTLIKRATDNIDWDILTATIGAMIEVWDEYKQEMYKTTIGNNKKGE